MPVADYLVPLAGAAPARAYLTCFPHAGSGSAAFAGWARQSPPGVGLLAVRLPGREGSFQEEPLRDARVIGRRVARMLRERVPAGIPSVLFGYCSGAFTAFETARALTAMGIPPRLLAVCSQAAPHRAAGAGQAHALPAGQFRSFVRAVGGTAPQVVDHDELWEMIEPALRADYAVAETYVTGPQPRITCDVVAFHGTGDDRVSRPDVAAWAEVTTGQASVRSLAGGHFVLPSAAAEILAGLTGQMRAGSAPGRDRGPASSG
jgi:pyochelin biosynthesis protein PchC